MVIFQFITNSLPCAILFVFFFFPFIVNNIYLRLCVFNRLFIINIHAHTLFNRNVQKHCCSCVLIHLKMSLLFLSKIPFADNV